MTQEKLNELIGDENTMSVTEMGGVYSIVVTRGANAVVLGHLTPGEGLDVFRWGVQKEGEIASKTDPEIWEQKKRDSMGGSSLCDLGEGWFKKYVNERAVGIGYAQPYIQTS